MHILALGGNGFIGSHFVDAGVASGHEFSVLSRKPYPVWPHGRPFRHLPGGFEALAAHPEWLDGIDAVWHGAWSTVPKTAAADPQSDVQTNLIGVLKVLELIRNTPSIKHLVFVSSGGAIYGPGKSQDMITEDHPLSPLGSYGITKLAAERYFQIFSMETGLPVTIIRPSNPYGPGQSSVGILGVITTFLYHAIAGTSATIFGGGAIVRDFLDVSDVANLMVKAMEVPVPGIYNCGSGKGVTLSEVVSTIEDIVGCEIKINEMPARAFDPERTVLDINRAKNTFGWYPKIDLHDGIKRLAQEFIL